MTDLSFFNELNSILKDEETDSDKETNQEICLTEFGPLDDNAITLACGHTFNYEPLFRDVKQQKQHQEKQQKGYVNVYHKRQLLKDNQIKCPFCRSIHNGLLPKIDGYEAIYGVNSPSRYCMKVIKKNKCKHVFKSGIRKGCLCEKPTNGDFCNQHLKKEVFFCCGIVKTGKNAGHYCTNHVAAIGDYCKIHQK